MASWTSSTNVPVDETATLLANGSLIAGDYLGTYYIDFNNLPLRRSPARQAFNLAIDRNYIVENVSQVARSR